MKNLYLGVDFGTTYTCVSYFENSTKILLNENGSYTTPSFIFFEKDSSNILFGSSALYKSKTDGTTISNWKRIIGKPFNNLSKDEIEYFQSKAINIININNVPHFQIEYNNDIVYYNTLDLTILYLKYIRNLINETVGQYNLNTVITIPVFFSTNSRSELTSAFTQSGFYVLKVLNEPTAASLAYDYLDSCRDILVFDCGGGTTDLSFIKTDIESNIFEVLDVVGNNFLGGEDITRNLVNYILDKYNIKNTWKNYKKLFIESENCKSYLSKENNKQYTFYVECILDNNNRTFDLNLKISQNLFLDINRDFFKDISTLISHFNSYNINNILFIGGSSKFFYFRNLFNAIFPKVNIIYDIDPDKAVAIGACKYSRLLNQEENDIDNDILILDVVPLSLGVQTTNGLFEIIIPRSTTLPVSRTKIFTNDSDDNEIEINIYQGESRFVNNNYYLNTLKIPLERHYNKGEVKISVEFNIDTSGVLDINVIINDKQIQTQMTLTKEYISNKLPENLDEIIYKYTVLKLNE